MLLETQEQVQDLRERLALADTPVGVDCETNWIKKGDKTTKRYIMGISIAHDKDTWYIPIKHSNWLWDSTNLVLPENFFVDIKSPIIVHGATVDPPWLKFLLGQELPKRNLHCTMQISHYLDENDSHDLDSVGRRYLGKGKEKDLKEAMKDEWDRMPALVMAEYAEPDAALPMELYEHLAPQYKEFLPLWEECDREFAVEIIPHMEHHGIRIDREHAQRLSNSCHARMDEIVQELEFDPTKSSQLHPKLFDPPPVGLGLVPLSLTPKTGKFQVNDSFLNHYAGHRIVALISEYRGLGKEASTYFDKYLEATSRGDPNFHAYFLPTGTVTGRLSGDLQQTPREGEVKKCFLPEEGKQLWEVDYRTIEYRLAAAYSEQPELLEIFLNEGDLHQMVADRIGYDRYISKQANYICLFGGGENPLGKRLGISPQKARPIVEAMRRQFPLIQRSIRTAELAAEQNGEIKYWSGRKRRFKYESEYRKAFNAAMQGGSFEIIKRGILRAWKGGADIRNCVHDSGWFNCDSEDDAKEIQKLMDVPKEEFGVPFSTDRKRLN